MPVGCFKLSSLQKNPRLNCKSSFDASVANMKIYANQPESIKQPVISMKIRNNNCFVLGTVTFISVMDKIILLILFVQNKPENKM